MTKQSCTCSCKECQEMCEVYSCLPSPEEAKTLIQAGHGSRLMLDTRYDPVLLSGSRTFVLLPAVSGYECQVAPRQLGTADCTFFTKDRLCEIHECKPTEGRIMTHGMSEDDLMEVRKAMQPVVNAWKSEEGRKISDDWILNYFRRTLREMVVDGYVLLDSRPNCYVKLVRIEDRRIGIRWAIREEKTGMVLNTKGEWKNEFAISPHDENFLLNYRWRTAEEAMVFWRNMVKPK